MNIKFKNKRIDIARVPFRGILSEIAREHGVSRQAIQQLAKKKNKEVLEQIIAKVEERKNRAILEQRLGVYEEWTKKKSQKRGRRVSEPLPQWTWGITA